VIQYKNYFGGMCFSRSVKWNGSPPSPLETAIRWCCLPAHLCFIYLPCFHLCL